MAQTLLGKIKVLISATLHSIVDQALQSNSLQVFDEYIRQAQMSMQALNSALVDMAVTIKTLKAKYDEASDEAAKLDLQVDAALKADKDTLAKIAQTKLNQQIEIAKTYQEQFQKQNQTYKTLMDVVQLLQAKVDTLHSQRDQVATLMQLIKSKNLVVRSIKDVQMIADDRAGQIVDSVRKELDVADARLEVASSHLSMQIDQEVNDVSLNAQLEERRQRLGLS